MSKEPSERYQLVKKLYTDGNGFVESLKKSGIPKTSFRKYWKMVKEGTGINSFEKDLKANNFNGANWKHGWLKTGDASIFIRNESSFDYESLKEDLIGEMRKHSPKYKKIKRDKEHKKGEHLLIISTADIHMGKRSIETETGGKYNREITTKIVMDGVRDLIERAKPQGISKILFIVGNDMLHVDNTKNTTTAGTPQDTDGVWHEMFLDCHKLFVGLIEMMVSVADVDIVYNPSNHDYMSGFMLVHSLESWFRLCPNVKFDGSPRHRKFYQFGDNLIGTTHGDGAKAKDLTSLMAFEVPTMWGESKHRYWFCHHIHHKIKKEVWAQIKQRDAETDFIGCTIEFLRSPSAADRWHYTKGYVGSPRAIEAFLHHKKHGQVGKMLHIID